MGLAEAAALARIHGQRLGLDANACYDYLTRVLSYDLGEPERAIHVGDSLDEDVRGAAACGIRPVLLRREGRSGAPDPAGVVTVTSLAQLDWP